MHNRRQKRTEATTRRSETPTRATELLFRRVGDAHLRAEETPRLPHEFGLMSGIVDCVDGQVNAHVTRLVQAFQIDWPLLARSHILQAVQGAFYASVVPFRRSC